MKRAGARDEGEGDQGEPSTGRRGDGGETERRVWGIRGEARKRRVCAEFVSRVDRSRVIGHSLFLRRDYARSIYRLYSIDYTNLSAAVLLSPAPFFPRRPTRLSSIPPARDGQGVERSGILLSRFGGGRRRGNSCIFDTPRRWIDAVTIERR